MATSGQRSWNSSLKAPNPRPKLPSKMPTTTAKVMAECPLCPIKVKPGQRVAMHFASGWWAHMGCMVRLLHATPVEA